MRDLPKYVHRERTRHGSECLYYRRRGRRVRLRETPGTEEFLMELKRAAGRAAGKPSLSEIADAETFVYFILLGNAKVKIGTARDPRRRFEALRAGIPGSAKLYYATPGGRHLERELHRLFQADRIRGEWFVYSKKIREWIEADEARRIEERRT